jgi:hypothetical protein
MTQFIAKSGGNTYHGKIYADMNRRISSRATSMRRRSSRPQGGGGLTETDLNRLHKYYDLNGDIGGYLKKDKLWWYGSVRKQDAESLLPNFPVKPFATLLHNVSAKGTYAINTNNKLIGYGTWGKKQQPNRLDTFLVAATAAIHPSADSTWNQLLGPHLQGRVGQRAQRSGVHRNPRRPVPLQVAEHPLHERAGIRGPPPTSSPAATATAGSTSRRGTRCSVHTATKDGWAGSHNFKIGGGFSTSASTTCAGRTASDTCRATCSTFCEAVPHRK